MKKESSSLIAVGIIAIATFILGFSVGQKNSTSEVDSITNYRLVNTDSVSENVEDIDFRTFWNVWDLIQSRYVDSDLDEKDMFNGAVKGLVGSLEDPATVFYSDDETQEYNRISAGDFEGIGAELGYNLDGQIIVKTPLKGYPAQSSGVRSGDIILGVDGESLENKSVFDAVIAIRGEKDTDVTLTVRSAGETEPHDIVVTRKKIHVESVIFDVNEGVGVLEIRRFTDESFSAWINTWDQSVNQVIESGVKSVVLDLRGNPGGFFDAAVIAAGEFLNEGDVVAYQKGRGGDLESFKVEKDGRLRDIKLVILIDEGSASASEILSGALKHYERGQIVGMPTFGKGTAQQVLSLEDGASLHITTQKWLLPDESWINSENKVTPNVEVELTREQFEQGLDPQFDKAMELANN